MSSTEGSRLAHDGHDTLAHDGHARCDPGPAAGDDDPADKLGAGQGDSLGDDTTERPAQEVDLGQSERLDELDRTSGECFDGLHRLACGVADADVVEPDDVTLGGQPVEELRIPPVDGAAEAVQQHERHATARSAAAIGESCGRGIDVEGVGPGGRNVGGHGRCSLCAAGRAGGAPGARSGRGAAVSAPGTRASWRRTARGTGRSRRARRPGR